MRKAVQRIWEKYDRHLAVGALVFGFILDTITLNRPDQLLDNAILLTYLTISGSVIFYMTMRASRGRTQGNLTIFLPLLLQFSFGNLASGLLVLYFRSGTLAQSLLFFLILAALLVGNEFLKSRYAQFRFNIAIYYLLLLCYIELTVPVLLHAIGPWVFLVCGVVSLVIITGYLWTLTLFAAKEMVQHIKPAGAIVGLIFICFSILYFLNIIPPVPLAMRDLGVYHSVLKRSDGSYLALYEKSALYQIWRDTSSTYRISSGTGSISSAFCFSSVFAPTDLKAPIYHTWQYYNEVSKEWEVRARISFPISGGRDDGYRGFSIKTALAPGEWRCNVETAQGSLIGRIRFTVVEGAVVPELSQKTL
jgi:hypothetical protein